MRNEISDAHAERWYVHPVMISGEEKRTAFGVTYGEPEEVLASVGVSSRIVKNEHGVDEVVTATIKWRVDGPLPRPEASKVTLPPEFGVKGERAVITAQRVYSGTGLTPDHVEVTLR